MSLWGQQQIASRLLTLNSTPVPILCKTRTFQETATLRRSSTPFLPCCVDDLLPPLGCLGVWRHAMCPAPFSTRPHGAHPERTLQHALENCSFTKLATGQCQNSSHNTSFATSTVRCSSHPMHDGTHHSLPLGPLSPTETPRMHKSNSERNALETPQQPLSLYGITGTRSEAKRSSPREGLNALLDHFVAHWARQADLCIPALQAADVVPASHEGNLFARRDEIHDHEEGGGINDNGC